MSDTRVVVFIDYQNVYMALDIAIGALKISYDVAVAATADTDYLAGS